MKCLRSSQRQIMIVVQKMENQILSRKLKQTRWVIRRLNSLMIQISSIRCWFNNEILPKEVRFLTIAQSGPDLLNLLMISSQNWARSNSSQERGKNFIKMKNLLPFFFLNQKSNALSTLLRKTKPIKSEFTVTFKLSRTYQIALWVIISHNKQTKHTTCIHM